MASLQNIYWNSGFAISEFSKLAQKTNRNIVKDRLIDLVKMYEKHPERLTELINSILEEH